MFTKYLKSHRKAGGWALLEALVGQYRFTKECKKCLNDQEPPKEKDKLMLYNGLKIETNYRDLVKKTLCSTETLPCGPPGCGSKSVKNTIKGMEETELLVIGVNRFNKNTGNNKSQKVSLSLIIDQDFGEESYSLAGIIEHVGTEAWSTLKTSK